MLLKRIESICRDRNITIARLEKECNIGNGTIRGWEKSFPRIDTLKKVAEYLGIPIEKLLEDEPAKEV